jgi:branched-chain amino acid transport system substrate-binding protein
MRTLVETFRNKHKAYPSDWAVMSYDGVQALRQAVEAAGSIETEAVRTALKGRTIETTRGKLSFRVIDNQLNSSAYVGRIADDPKYPFPVFADFVEFKGEEIWRPEAEIAAARK